MAVIWPRAGVSLGGVLFSVKGYIIRDGMSYGRHLWLHFTNGKLGGWGPLGWRDRKSEEGRARRREGSESLTN